jgi:hypothetical protein
MLMWTPSQGGVHGQPSYFQPGAAFVVSASGIAFVADMPVKAPYAPAPAVYNPTATAGVLMVTAP